MLSAVDAPPEIVAELRAREPITHHDPIGADRAAIEELLVGDFFEVGASGRVYDRERVIDIVVDRYERDDSAVVGEIEDFRVRVAGPETYIVTYTLLQPDGHSVRTTRRATVWTNVSGAWRIVYHQGTIADA